METLIALPTDAPRRRADGFVIRDMKPRYIHPVMLHQMRSLAIVALLGSGVVTESAHALTEPSAVIELRREAIYGMTLALAPTIISDIDGKSTVVVTDVRYCGAKGSSGVIRALFQVVNREYSPRLKQTHCLSPLPIILSNTTEIENADGIAEFEISWKDWVLVVHTVEVAIKPNIEAKYGDIVKQYVEKVDTKSQVIYSEANIHASLGVEFADDCIRIALFPEPQPDLSDKWARLLEHAATIATENTTITGMISHSYLSDLVHQIFAIRTINLEANFEVKNVESRGDAAGVYLRGTVHVPYGDTDLVVSELALAPNDLGVRSVEIEMPNQNACGDVSTEQGRKCWTKAIAGAALRELLSSRHGPLRFASNGSGIHAGIFKKDATVQFTVERFMSTQYNLLFVGMSSIGVSR